MLIRLYLLLALTGSTFYAVADPVLGHLDFSEGEWALIGVPVHNYQKIPVQTELGTFVTEDIALLRTLQRRWDFESTFDDKCDYHYALKFYRDGNLVETLQLNLHCGYITLDGFSYTFPVGEFDLVRDRARTIPWSRIRFEDSESLVKAINTLDATENVYWYDDVQQYLFPGYFMISVNDLPWNADRDSLHQQVSLYLSEMVKSDQFYLQEYYYLVTEGEMTVRYLVNCSESMAITLSEQGNTPQRWRSHFQSNNGVISILALGVDERRFRFLMGQ